MEEMTEVGMLGTTRARRTQIACRVDLLSLSSVCNDNDDRSVPTFFTHFYLTMCSKT